MLTNPFRGSTVQVWYRASLRPFMPYHGKRATVEGVGRGRPRNHAVMILPEMVWVVVPRGNLRPLKKVLEVLNARS